MSERINKVLYNVDQRGETTAQEKKTARDNIGAISADDIPEIVDDRYKLLQSPLLQTFAPNAVIDRFEQDAQGVATIHCSYLTVATDSSDGLMSASDKAKLNTIAYNAEQNVQSDWEQTDTSADDYIRNRPSIPTKTSDLTNDSGFITASQVPQQVNADWLCDDPTDPSYIENKPDIPELSWQQETQGSSNSFPADQLKIHQDFHTVTMHTTGGSDIQLGYIAATPQSADNGKVLTAINDGVGGVAVQWDDAPEAHTVGFIDIQIGEIP